VTKDSQVQKKGLSLIKQPSSFNWSSAGFTKVLKDAVPATTKTELNRAIMLACALDYHPLSFIKYEGFQLLAQCLIDVGATESTCRCKNVVQQPQYLFQKRSAKIG